MFVVNTIRHDGAASAGPAKLKVVWLLRSAGGRAAETTLSRLLSAGWLPHTRGFVRGCLDLPAGVDACRPHSSPRGFPCRGPAPSDAQQGVSVGSERPSFGGSALEPSISSRAAAPPHGQSPTGTPPSHARWQW